MREWVLNVLISLAVHRRRIVYAVALILTLVLGAASERLQLDVRWSTLLPESMPEVMEFKKIDTNFYQPGNMIIAIRGPDQVKLEALTDEVTALLENELVCEQSKTVEECKAEELYARYIYGKLPDEWLADHAIRLAKPKDAKRLRDLLADPRLPAFLEHLNDDFESEYTDVENVVEQERQIISSLDAVQELVKTLDGASAETVKESRVTRNVRDLTIGKPYFFSLDNTMSLVMVAPSAGTDDVEAMPAMDRKIETLLAPLAQEYPDYRFERTGMIAIGRDEMDSVGPQTMLITAVALVIVFLMLVWNFRSSVTPVLALVPIVLGIIWSTGIVALTLGSMNLFTVMMGVVLLGLGIDFSIHIANRFHEEVVARQSVEKALRLALGETGLGVITGAVTTSVAFFTLMIAETKGIEEFGFCTGTGVLATLAAVMLVLPALLATWAERRLKRKKPIMTSHDFSLLGAVAEWMGRRRAAVIIMSVLVTALGMYAGFRLDWEWNWMELEPEGLRSIELQDEIINKFKLSISLSMLTAESVEESRALRKTLKDRRVVGDVDDVSLWVSRPDFAESSSYIQDLREALEQHPTGANGPSLDSEAGRARLAEELDRLWANIVEIQALSFTGGQDRVVDKTTQLVARRENRDAGLLRQVADRFAEAEDIDWESFESLAEDFARAMRTQALRMAEGDDPVTLDMVPADIRAKYISDTIPGFLMQIYPKKNLYEREDLEIFQDVAGRVHPNVTGLPQMFLKMNLETIREGKLAFFVAIGVIFFVLLLDFRRPLVAVLAFLPLISGLALMMGVMWLLGEKLNYINLIAFPLIIGIGVDDGVHFFHRFIQEGKGGIRRAVTSVGRAMLMTSLTTMIGFGSLMLYLMRGMASLGLVLFVGVGTCLLVTFTLVPALSKLFEDRIVSVR